jgi:RNA polymerase sigma-70 factor (ECF subfamily)
MKTIQYPEETIVEGCLREDKQFQKLLYEKYYGGMMTICARYASNREEARDILHEGFMKVFMNLHKFELGTNLGGWIRKIMVNTAIDIYRKAAKIPPTQEVNVEIHQQRDTYDIVAQLSVEEILKLVQTLSPSYRIVFNMYVMDGYSHKEIAEILGTSEGSSKSNLSKARIRLQKMILDLREQDNKLHRS